MNLDALFEKIEDSKNDVEKCIKYSSVINHLEVLIEHIGFQKSDNIITQYINDRLKETIDDILKNNIKITKNRIKFLLYYNNEKRDNNSISR